MVLQRKQIRGILADLEKKMVIIVGPRQVGKTWIAREVMKHFAHTQYLNWDNPDDRAIIRAVHFAPTLDLLVLDEIHKMRNWKSFVKGIYDTKPATMRMLITGSARLDALKKVGDAMTGRYFAHRILPLSLSELKGTPYEGTMEGLLERSGFPEPFLAESVADVMHWRNQYVENNIRAEVLDFATAHDLSAMADIVKILRTKVGSPISYKNIADDIGISPITVKRYIQILEDVHLVFVVRTYTKKIARAIKKEPKIYFYDVGLVSDSAARFENFVALSLVKHAYYLHDTKGVNLTISYLRTKDNREVDFAIVQDDALAELVEVKISDTQPSAALRYYKERHQVPVVQVVKEMRHQELDANGVRIVRAKEYLEGLAM